MSLTPDQVDLANLMLIDTGKGELEGVHDKLVQLYGKDLDLSHLDLNNEGVYLTNQALVIPIADKSGNEQLLVLDKGTETAKHVLDGIFGIAKDANQMAADIKEAKKNDSKGGIMASVMGGLGKMGFHSYNMAEGIKDVKEKHK